MKHAREDYQRFQDPEGKIPEDEPVFLIRGQDKIAPTVLRYYANLNDTQHGDPQLSDQVREQAERMDQWQKDVKSKIADL
jgi:hypothetical protein